MSAAGSGFDWFTGLATVAEDPPAALLATGGLGEFFAGPNRATFGARVPRVLMHECLHGFQLAGSRWLQRMVAEEWQRVLELERTGTAPPQGPLRASWGRPPPGYSFCVRDLVECLARFWDVHIRGARRIIAEHEGGDVAAADGGRPTTDDEYETAIRAGQKLDSYPRPYLWLQEAAFHAPAMAALGPADRGRMVKRARFAAQVLLPIAGFVALNTDDPVRAYVIALDAVLAQPAPEWALGNAADSIEIDWLIHWPWLVQRMSEALLAQGLPVQANPAGLQGEAGWTEHPVWRWHAARAQSLQTGLTYLITEAPVPAATASAPWRPIQDEMLRDLLRRNAFAAYALMGIPDLRLHLGSAFAPPVLRFGAASLPAQSSASPRASWPIAAEELVEAVEGCAKRHRVLRTADLMATYRTKQPALAS